MSNSGGQKSGLKKAGESGAGDGAIASKIKASANQIWLAGLGAYAKAEQEGGRWFEGLVRDGELTRAIVDKQLLQAKEKVGEVRERVIGVRDRAADSWERIEHAFDERVAGALGRLNIPNKHDVDELAGQVAKLQARVKKLESRVASGVDEKARR